MIALVAEFFGLYSQDYENLFSIALPIIGALISTILRYYISEKNKDMWKKKRAKQYKEQTRRLVKESFGALKSAIEAMAKSDHKKEESEYYYEAMRQLDILESKPVGSDELNEILEKLDGLDSGSTHFEESIRERLGAIKNQLSDDTEVEVTVEEELQRLRQERDVLYSEDQG